jgi:pyruvate,water dikinase
MVNLKHILFFNQISIADIAEVGGKNASLGEMYCQLNPIGIKIPNGFHSQQRDTGCFVKKTI